jgi:hypothetical protein
MLIRSPSLRIAVKHGQMGPLCWFGIPRGVVKLLHGCHGGQGAGNQRCQTELDDVIVNQIT